LKNNPAIQHLDRLLASARVFSKTAVKNSGIAEILRFFPQTLVIKKRDRDATESRW
jgi:hypothetical protein